MNAALIWQVASAVWDIVPKVFRAMRHGFAWGRRNLALNELRALRTPLSTADIVYSSNCSRHAAESLRQHFEAAGWVVNLPAVPQGEMFPYLSSIRVTGYSPRLVNRVQSIVSSLSGRYVSSALIDGSSMAEDNPKWAHRDAKVWITVGYLTPG